MAVALQACSRPNEAVAFALRAAQNPLSTVDSQQIIQLCQLCEACGGLKEVTRLVTTFQSRSYAASLDVPTYLQVFDFAEDVLRKATNSDESVDSLRTAVIAFGVRALSFIPSDSQENAEKTLNLALKHTVPMKTLAPTH